MSARNFLLIPLLSALFLVLAPFAQATHLKGAEITYRVDELIFLKVHVEVSIYLNTRSPIREDVITLYLGDGSTKRVQVQEYKRERAASGEYTAIFQTEHVYAMPGTYRLTYLGINRNEAVFNINIQLAIPLPFITM